MSRRSLALAVLSGLLLTASFPNPDYSLFAWFALVPFLLALRGRTVRSGFLLAFLFGLVFFCSNIYWVTNSLHVYGRVPLLLATLITLLLCAVFALFIALFGAMIVHLRETRPGIVFLAAPAVWVTLELARTHLFSGFPWGLVGYSQYRTLPVIQVADLAGVYGVSFVIVLVNTAIAELISDGKRFVPLMTASLLLIAVLGYGYHRLSTEEEHGRIKIAVVQGNIEQSNKWDPAYQSTVIATYKRLTREALRQRPDLLIWPETATPFYFEGADAPYPALTEGLRKFVRSAGTPLLTGSPTYEIRDRRHLLRNSAFLLDRNGMTDAIYHKTHLVPFGEYVPMKKILFFIEKLVQPVGEFQAGTENTVMQVPLPSGDVVAMGTVICYEIIFPDLVRRFVNDGATVIANITNDGWFGRTDAPYQHFSMAVLRAVENRVPVARSANTGISGFIDANGRILDASGIFTDAVLTRSLTPGAVKTFYTRHGDIFAWLCTFGTILAVIPLPRSKQRVSESFPHKKTAGP